MKTKKVPMRKCSGCMNMFPKKELVRVVKSPDKKDENGNVLEKGSVFFIDELNARLHPLLVRYFLLTFLNPEINTNHAQLVFTTHDTWQLSNQLLRRDEIWFVEKDERLL